MFEVFGIDAYVKIANLWIRPQGGGSGEYATMRVWTLRHFGSD
jgi:hypothetical protein